MQQTRTKFVAYVKDECEQNDCTETSTTVSIVKGDYGTDGLAAYCDEHAEERDRTPVGDLTNAAR